ncbi:hypothetical protein CSUI_006984 [Cystoisospora suis]|uniref:Uncharacterized protein n=1 Tax=Cystoisospora suis TaxID=483139 RepID=A0A2C6KPY2_9APIC|nr:hypothetical protein CSUI_006984 [Cystoisospora suis]
MAVNPLASSDLQFAVRKILKQHQRECEDAGDFGKAREAQAALQELQYRCELEGLCRLFCRHYRQLSDADAAYEKQLHTLEMQWQTVQLPEVVERIRKWRTQLQGRQKAELSTIATQETEEENKTKPRFRREAFELQKRMQYLGASGDAAKAKVPGHDYFCHQGRYDEAEELQRRLRAQQRMDAEEQEALRQLRRERQSNRLLEAHGTERRALENRVERLIEYHNRQNATAVDTLRRKHQGLRRSLTHVQGLELQKALQGLKCVQPEEGVRLVSSALAVHLAEAEQLTRQTADSGLETDARTVELSVPIRDAEETQRSPFPSSVVALTGPPKLVAAGSPGLQTTDGSATARLPPTVRQSACLSSPVRRRTSSQVGSPRRSRTQTEVTVSKGFRGLCLSPRSTNAGGAGNKGAGRVLDSRSKVKSLPGGVDLLQQEILSAWKEGASKVAKEKQASVPLR